jgi:hypothetical protein
MSMPKKDSPTSDPPLDALYREHPDGFVAGRNQLVKDLRASGARDEAERVKALKRPSVAAWLVNRTALESPAELEALAKASIELEKAQRRALEGKKGGTTELRAAAAREREAVDLVLDAAQRGAEQAGHPPSAHALDLVAETLRAASVDAGFRERVRSGRIERERSAATLGTPADVSPPRGAGSEKRRDVAQAQRELKRLEEELTRATAREERLREQVDQAAEALRLNKRKLADSKRETTRLSREVKAAGRQASSS